MGFTISKNQGSGRTVITVTPEEKNSTDKDIVQILTVEAVDGSTKEVKLIHKKGEGNYEYDFRVSPTELYFEPTGESKEVTIISTKQMVINGKKVGDPVTVDYTRENSGDISGSGTTIIMSLNDNMYNERVGQVIFTQGESGKTISVTCKQGKKETSGDIGIIKLWSGPGVPENYVLCNGGQVSIAEYPELYKSIGEKYNTSSTRAGYISVPDLSGRFVVGVDSSDPDYSSIGNTGGEKEHRLTVEEMPSHTHSYNKIRIETHEWGDNANNRPHPFYDSGAQTGPTGGNQPHENRPPYYVLAYVMKVR
jgi:microcystin-dependent protein